MSSPRQPIYQRLPEIYRIRDGEQQPPGQLQAYLGLMDEAHAAIRDNIEALYHDLFADTCADWVVPYLADLLGASHLSGDPWTLRADVARTINHRRRKGTLGAVESLTHALSGWAAHAVEMRERLVWNQHLNHQRPDAGGQPPLPLSAFRSDARRGGTVNLRDRALLSLLNGPFDPFAHVADVKPSGLHNLPNLAVFLWRLQAYTVTPTRPGAAIVMPPLPVVAGNARFAVRVSLHPQSEPMVLFNTHRFHADDEPPELSAPDAVPGPMPWARLTQDTPAGRPGEYVEVQRYPAAGVPVRAERPGLTLHVPDGPFTAATPWRFRGANLCAWEDGLQPALRPYEIVIDPDRGRIVIGTMGANAGAEANPLAAGLYVSVTHGFAGPVGAQPVTRASAPTQWQGQPATLVVVDRLNAPGFSLQQALANVHQLTQPLIVEIRDSLVHELDLNTVVGSALEGGTRTLRLGRSLWIRAADRQRPVIRLARPLAFRPDDVLGAGAPALMDQLVVRLEGLYLTRAPGYAATAPLIARAALNQLQVQGCTLDPGGVVALNGTREPIRVAAALENTYGFALPAEETAFDQTPEVVIERSICGPLAMDSGYRLDIRDSILDAGSGVEAATPALAVRAATGNAETAWGPTLAFSGITCLGRVRVSGASGRGGLFVHALQVLDTQTGCIKYSRFAIAADNRLPSQHGCFFGDGRDLHFGAETFGRPGYARLEHDCHAHVLEQGPNNDEMGAFGFQLNSHKWKNLQIRYREYMPVGIRAVLVTVT
ncbi:phage tail protein [Arenimonas oryziterrae]|uniref:Tail protein n=1 Tax=Arenimonas oryziterrae DSM 21050 = YC6267 TaxID=1121015 RepID=A0A091AUC9_9GAMM|nr:phage tail protein [Arenimonas oryziterrae]KFN42971.1 hypothetical protein N789_12670 [Arenimonas oryziterrae DSM 21050 = YC6267]